MPFRQVFYIALADPVADREGACCYNKSNTSPCTDMFWVVRFRGSDLSAPQTQVQNFSELALEPQGSVQKFLHLHTKPGFRLGFKPGLIGLCTKPWQHCHFHPQRTHSRNGNHFASSMTLVLSTLINEYI